MVDKDGYLLEVGDYVLFTLNNRSPVKSLGKIVRIESSLLKPQDVAHIWVVGKTDELLWKRTPCELEKKIT